MDRKVTVLSLGDFISSSPSCVDWLHFSVFFYCSPHWLIPPGEGDSRDRYFKGSFLVAPVDFPFFLRFFVFSEGKAVPLPFLRVAWGAFLFFLGVRVFLFGWGRAMGWRWWSPASPHWPSW